MKIEYDLTNCVYVYSFGQRSTYEGQSKSFLPKYEGVELEVWSLAYLLVIMSIVAMQDFRCLWLLLDLQMTLRNRKKMEIAWFKNGNSRFFSMVSREIDIFQMLI